MRHAYLLLIQGVPFAFTDEAGVADGWTFDDRVVKVGLTVPSTLRFGLDMETGMIEEDSATFQILDIDGTVPYFFGGLQKSYSLLAQRITPLEDPAPVGPLSDDGTLDLTSGFLGTEAIGPALERDYYSATPLWAPMPGQDHPAFDEPLPVFTTAAFGPYLIEGRRVALYRIPFDEETGDWCRYQDTVAAATAGGWSPMLWWGTLRQAGKVDGRIWSIQCAGPGSWLRRSLNTRTTTKWYQVSAALTVDDREDRIGVFMEKRYYFDGSHLVCGSDYTTYTVNPASLATIVSSITTALNAVGSLAGPGGDVWDVHAGIGAGVITFTLEDVTISSTEVGGFYAMACQLILSRKVWRALGYDPEAGKDNDEGPGPNFQGPGFPFLNAHPDLFVEPLVKYHAAHFWTVPFGTPLSGHSGEIEWVGTDAPKIYKPLYVGGVSVLSGDPAVGGGQVIRIAPENNEVIYCETQTIRAHYSAAEINANACTAARLWVFRGKIQLPRQPSEAEQPDPKDTIQVARCSWVPLESGTVGVDETGINRGLVIEEWLDPRLYGFNYEPIDAALGWASNDRASPIECSPLAHFGAYFEKPDHAADTILRTLVSTGAAAWAVATYDEVDDGALEHATTYLTPGANDLGLPWPAGDFEIYDLGLQVPAAMVDSASVLAAAEDLPGGASGRLAVGKVAVQGGPLQSEDLFTALFAPRGWCFQLKRGRFGVFAPHISAESKYEEGVDFEILEADLHGTAGDPASTIPSVELRPVFPYDRAVFSHTGLPMESWTKGQVELKLRARDLGSRARSGSRTRAVAAPDLLATSWFAAGDQTNPNNAPTETIGSWTGATAQLWERELPAWLAQPHRLLTGLRISRPKGQDIYPGAILKLTNPWPANSVGTYGLVGVYCRVLAVTHETDSCACIVDALVEAAPPNTLKWAPILRVVDDTSDSEARYNAARRTFYVQHWGGATPPLGAFIKPADLNYPDDPAKFLGLQFDGSTWREAFSGFVQEVSTVDDALVHTVAGLTGTFVARQYTVLVLAPHDDVDQAAWVGALYARHTGLPATGVPKLP